MLTQPIPTITLSILSNRAFRSFGLDICGITLSEIISCSYPMEMVVKQGLYEVLGWHL